MDTYLNFNCLFLEFQHLATSVEKNEVFLCFHSNDINR